MSSGKWHINKKNVTLECNATVRACRFKGANDHFDSFEEANAEALRRTEAENKGKTVPDVMKRDTEAKSDHGNYSNGFTSNDEADVEALKLDQRTYDVYADQLDEAEKRIKRANKRLEKNGIEDRFEYTVTEYTKVVKGVDGESVEVKRATIVLNEPRMAYNGYTFMARVEEVAPGEFVAYAATGRELNGFRPDSMECEHCHKPRHRNKVYVVQDENGAYKTVGGACVQLYTGMAPAGLSAMEFSLDEMEDDSWDRTPRGQRVESKDEVLCLAYVLTKESGYHNANSEYPTKWEIYKALYPNPKELDWAIKIRSQAAALDAAAIRKEAEDALAGNDSDWAMNVRSLMKAEYVNSRGVPTLASSMAAIHKARENKKKALEWTPGFVGEPKDKLTSLPVRVVSVYETEEQYGYGEPRTVYRVTMQAEDGKKIQWKSYGGDVPAAGEEVLLNASIKGHNNWKGVDSTLVTRAKFAGKDETSTFKRFVSDSDY